MKLKRRVISMAIGGGKGQNSDGMITSGSYVANYSIGGQKYKMPLNCPGIIGKDKEAARVIALEHAKGELIKKHRGKKVNVRSVSL
jgi:hypothetical protein